MTSQLYLHPPTPFNFEQTLFSHGWISLQPNSWDAEKKIFQRVERLNNKEVVLLHISEAITNNKPLLQIDVEHSGKLTESEKQLLQKSVAYMLRTDEDLGGFYTLCSKYGGKWLNALNGAGRLLRSPTLFEDIVKTICTTNIQWGGTKRMIHELVNAFGQPYKLNPALKAFPTTKAISSIPLDEFNNKVRLGYRSAYIFKLAQDIESGEVDLQFFKQKDVTTTDLKKELLKIKGIGNYAAATLMMLLGHYDELPVDSVFRDFVSKKYFKDKHYSDKKALAIYHRWGIWKHLAYWYDLWQGFDESD